jgi:outer membrane protein assembly factor BamB
MSTARFICIVLATMSSVTWGIGCSRSARQSTVSSSSLTANTVAQHTGADKGTQQPVPLLDLRNNRRVHLAGPRLGKVVWRITGVQGQVFVGDDALVRVVGRRDVWCVAPNGRVSWRTSLSYEASGAAGTGPGGRTYVGTEGGSNVDPGRTLWCLGPHGDFDWSRVIPSEPESSVTATEDGTLYLATLYGDALALDANGQIKWQLRLSSGHMPGKPAVSTDVVYFTSEDHHLYALDRESGRLRWRYEVTPRVGLAPAVTDDGTVVFSDNVKLYWLDPNGTARKVIPLEGATGACVDDIALASDGTVYVPREEGLSAFDKNGALKWTWPTRRPTAPVVDAEGALYVSTQGVLAAKLDRGGRVLWTVGRTEAAAGLSGPALGPDGRCYVCSPNDGLVAIE